MKNLNYGAIAIAMMSVAVIGCSDDETGIGPDPLNLFNTETEQELTQECVNFGFDVLSKYDGAGNSVTSNMVISPVALSNTLSMIANGAEADAASQIFDLMGYGRFDVTDINDFNNKSLTKWMLQDNNIFYYNKNSLWAALETEANDDFTSLIADKYQAPTKFIDPSSYVFDVNTWCKKETDERISKLLGNDSEIPQAALYNATYFCGRLYEPFKFDANASYQGTFNNADGSSTTTTFMCRDGKGFYAENDEMQSCVLRFGDCHYDIAFILPKENVTVGQVIESLKSMPAHELWSLLDPESGAEMSLSVPRLDMATELSMSELLADMGVYGMESADFNGITNEGIDLKHVKQTTVFALNENAAYPNPTFIPDTGLNAIIDGKITMKCDRPFIYMVYRSSSYLPIIIGRVNTFAE